MPKKKRGRPPGISVDEKTKEKISRTMKSKRIKKEIYQELLKLYGKDLKLKKWLEKNKYKINTWDDVVSEKQIYRESNRRVYIDPDDFTNERKLP